MAASTPFARSYLRQVWADAQANAASLLATLQGLNAAAITATKTGQTILSTAGNGRSVTFADPGSGMTPEDIVELLDRLLRLYDAAVADGMTTDATRYAWMLAALAPVRSVAHNFAIQINR